MVQSFQEISHPTEVNWNSKEGGGDGVFSCCQRLTFYKSKSRKQTVNSRADEWRQKIKNLSMRDMEIFSNNNKFNVW